MSVYIYISIYRDIYVLESRNILFLLQMDGEEKVYISTQMVGKSSKVIPRQHK